MKSKLPIIKGLILMPLSFLLIATLNCYAGNENPVFSIVTDKAPGVSVSHGLTKLTDALQAKNISFEKVGSMSEARGNSVIVTGLASGKGAAAQMLKAGSRAVPEVSEALTIWKTDWQKKPVWVISGFDDRGLMYGLLDVANRISWSADGKSPMSEVKEITEKPDVSERAVSIYTMNRAYWESRFYDEAYWARYLDMLAQNRFNSLVVIFGYENGGFLAPAYPYFFDVEEFPDVQMVGITAQEQQRNLAAFNNLIKMAHDRGIKFTAGIWDHIYRGGVQGGGIPGTKDAPNQPVHGLVWGVTGDNLTSYNKTALAKFIKLVPDLDAIQFRMHNESGLKHDEQDTFWLDVFRMVKETAPNLRLDLRAKELPESVIQSAVDVGVNFRITTKYWMEQMGMPYHPTRTNPEKSPIRHSYAYLLRYPQRYKMHWRLWSGGTTRILLWGDPEYARRFAESTHLYDGDGFEVNEPLATKMEAQPHDALPFDLLKPQYRYYDWEFERYWHFFQVFGRIGYNPETSPEVWQKEFEIRFGKKTAPFIETALHKASWILPRIVTSVYPYSGFPTTRGWAEKQRLGDLPAYAKNEGSDIQQFANFDEEAQLLIEGGEMTKILPSTNSLWFEQTSADINKLITEAEKAIGNNRNKEFISTITDLKILSNLALYHSRRIPAAVSYRLFERTQDVSALEDAIAYERKAIEAWRQIVAAAGDVYADDLMMGVCIANLCGHWRDELVSLEKGLVSLEQRRHNFKAEGTVKTAPDYKPVTNANYDKLFQITHQPVTSVPIGNPLTVSVKISVPEGVKWVRLRYRNINQEMDYQILPMRPTGEKDSYQVIVPSEQINPKWDLMYFIEVLDNKGNGRIYPDLNKETPYIFVKIIR
ncbi:hypothetical protein [Daejeonella sp.]|uniref:hypothetical protein n=1 Tax=Daejeonella sp. TaxID=2805397 RepID=UPI00398389C0